MYQILQFKVTGAAPLLLHNGQLSNPLNPIVKEMKTVSAKRQKTEADMEQMAKLEWMGSLYVDNGAIVIPGEVWEAVLTNAAKKSKKGNQAKAGVFVEENSPLVFPGSEKKPAMEKLWEDERFRFTVPARVQNAKVMRTRPRFDKWEASVVVHFNDELLNPAEITEIFKVAGEVVGVGDWRPRFGRFTVTPMKKVA